MHPWGLQAVRTTSPFGMRCHPIKVPPKGPPCIKQTGSAKGKTRAKVMHNGVDYAWGATPNAIMYAVADGNIFLSENRGGGGYTVGIDHGEQPDQFGNLRKWISYYCHLHPQSAAMSPIGRTVKEGEPVAIENNTGGSTGAHLHFMLQAKGHPQATDSKGNLNPELFIDRLQPKTARPGLAHHQRPIRTPPATPEASARVQAAAAGENTKLGQAAGKVSG